jgi:hypothetical protein
VALSCGKHRAPAAYRLQRKVKDLPHDVGVLQAAAEDTLPVLDLFRIGQANEKRILGHLEENRISRGQERSNGAQL